MWIDVIDYLYMMQLFQNVFFFFISKLIWAKWTGFIRLFHIVLSFLNSKQWTQLVESKHENQEWPEEGMNIEILNN